MKKKMLVRALGSLKERSWKNAKGFYFDSPEARTEFARGRAKKFGANLPSSFFVEKADKAAFLLAGTLALKECNATKSQKAEILKGLKEIQKEQIKPEKDGTLDSRKIEAHWEHTLERIKLLAERTLDEQEAIIFFMDFDADFNQIQRYFLRNAKNKHQ